jgi:hypothetical protein
MQALAATAVSVMSNARAQTTRQQCGRDVSRNSEHEGMSLAGMAESWRYVCCPTSIALKKNLLLGKHAMHVAADDLLLPSPRNFSTNTPPDEHCRSNDIHLLSRAAGCTV